MSVSLLALFLAAGFTTPATARNGIELSNEQVENIVRLSYPYVALYNVNNKFALDDSGPMYVGGWNKIRANTTVADHTLQAIARPNNDTLYLTAMIDVRQEPMILESIYAPDLERYNTWTAPKAEPVLEVSGSN